MDLQSEKAKLQRYTSQGGILHGAEFSIIEQDISPIPRSKLSKRRATASTSGRGRRRKTKQENESKKAGAHSKMDVEQMQMTKELDELLELVQC